MTEGPAPRLVRLFEEVAELAPAERAAYLESLRRDDPELAQTLEELLRWDGTEAGIRIDSKPFRIHGSGVDSGARATSGATAELLRRLAEHAPTETRYRIEGEVARGGMGTILRARDEDLDRDLAMKVVHGPPEPPETDSARLGFLLSEARIQGRMNHPGVVPVHELGRHPERGVYFTMQLVRGRDLGEVFRLAREGREGWSQVRALNVLLRVCETMSYAHSKGVIHRDLKPANVMVGRFGQVYVMDWGIARVLGQADPHDLRLRTTGELGEEEEDVSGAVLQTMDGRVVGTPSYMPLEQAEGRIEDVGPHSDVYAVGAMLYELLTGRAPYQPESGGASARTVLAMILLGPPPALHTLCSDVAPELEAICEKAMARDPRERYPTTQAMGEDVSAWLEGRVVQAHRTGAVVELTKWVRRNRGLATAVGVAVLALAVGLVVSLFLMAQADSQRRIAAAERANVLRLRALQDLEDLEREASDEGMWPPLPDRADRYRHWLARGRALVAGLDPAPEGESVGYYALLDQVRARVEAASVADDATTANDGAERWWLNQLAKLVGGLEAFADAESGLLGAGVSPGNGWGVARRLAFATSIEERSVSGAEAQRLWEEAAAYARDSAPYDGLELAPQLGLLPLGPDPTTGLLEFAHLASGRVPERGAGGALALDEGTGIVLVLLPGGRFDMGAQGDPALPNYSPIVEQDEGPVHAVELAPFFLAKHELTQGQWLAFQGENPATYGPGTGFGGKEHDLRHPVESVRWGEAAALLARMGLELPTEAQWEYAARAGTTSTWWFGEHERDCADAANVADAFSRDHGGPSGLTYEDWDDGYTAHAPVGSFRANAFGLFDVCGNVWEWCRDHEKRYDAPVAPGDGERQGPPRSSNRTARGGAFTFTAEQARSSNRYGIHPDVPQFNVGLRAARKLER